MDSAAVHEDDPGAQSCRGELFFIEDPSSSDDEPEIRLSEGKRTSSSISRDKSPPLLLAFSNARQWVHSDSSHSPASSPDGPVVKEEEDDSDQTIEEWMILGSEGQEGDSSIQLHLSYWNSSVENSGDEGEATFELENLCYHFTPQ